MVQLTEFQCVLLRQHIKDDRLHLSSGFFRRLVLEVTNGTASSNEKDTESAVLQIQGGASMHEGLCAQVQVTLCDGMHYYEDCFFSENLRDGLNKHGIQSDGEQFAIIIVRRGGIHFQESSRKFFVRDYGFICMAEKIQGFQFCARRELLLYTKNTTKAMFLPITIMLKKENTTEEADLRSKDLPRYKPPQTNRVRSPHDSDSDTPIVPGASSSGTRSAPPIPEKPYIGFHSPQHSPIPEPTASRQRTPPPPYTRSPSPLHHNPYESPKYVLETATPIADIVPGMNNWHIVGLCTSLDEVGITKKNVKAFNFEITDAAGTTIKIYAYGNNAEQLLEIIYEGQCYTVSNAIIKKVLSPIHNCTGHRYELESQGPNVVAASSASIEIPPLELNVVSVSEVNKHVNTFVDVLAVIHSVGPLINFMNKNKTACVMKDLELMDMTGSIVLFTLFGRQARDFDEHFKGLVIGIKQVRVQNHNGTIKISGARRFEITPDNIAKDELHNWYKEQKEEKTSGSASGKTVLNTTSEFNAIPLRKAAEHVGEFVDVLVIVDFVHPIEKFRNSKGQECTLRKVVLVDMTNTRLTLRLWGEGAEAFSDREGFIIGIKGAEIEAYKGSIFLKDGRRDVNVPVQKVNKLYQWYKNRPQNDE